MDLSHLNELLGGRIETDKSSNEGAFLVIFGSSGAGKTSTLCQAPSTILVQAGDESAGALKQSGSIPANLPVITTTGYFDCVDVLKKLTPEGSSKPAFKNIVIDGGSGMARWCDEYTVEHYFAGDITEFTGWGGTKGEKTASKPWREFLVVIEQLRASGVWVYLICHSTVISAKNPNGTDYLKTVPMIGGGRMERMQMTVADADAVLLFEPVIDVAGGDAKTQKGARAKGGSLRVIRTTLNAAYEAKNRFNLPDTIELGESPLEGARALRDAIKSGRENKGK